MVVQLTTEVPANENPAVFRSVAVDKPETRTGEGQQHCRSVPASSRPSCLRSYAGRAVLVSRPPAQLPSPAGQATAPGLAAGHGGGLGARANGSNGLTGRYCGRSAVPLQVKGDPSIAFHLPGVPRGLARLCRSAGRSQGIRARVPEQEAARDQLRQRGPRRPRVRVVPS